MLISRAIRTTRTNDELSLPKFGSMLKFNLLLLTQEIHSITTLDLSGNVVPGMNFFTSTNIGGLNRQHCVPLTSQLRRPAIEIKFHL